VVIRVLEHGRAKQVQRAAGMLVGLLKFKRQLDLGRLETLRMNGVVPLCMNQCVPAAPKGPSAPRSSHTGRRSHGCLSLSCGRRSACVGNSVGHAA